MSEIKVTHCKGNISMQDDYMDFINYVFGFNGSTSDFYKLLPKLYKPEYDPCASSYVTLEGEKIKAAVGAFDIDLDVCGNELKCRGIGNVAVHPFSRSKGYMRKLMEMSIDDMIKDGVDFSFLGGRRQRYNYFSYEKGGESYNFTVNADNMRHVFGKERKMRFTLRPLTPDSEVLDDIAKLYERVPFHAKRDRSKLFDILCSWSSVPFAAYDENNKFVGYFVYGREAVKEIFTVESADFKELVACAYDKIKKIGNLSVILPPFCVEYIEQILTFCEGYTVGTNELYTVFNYRKVCDALLKLKSQYSKLCDGEIVVEINGRAGKEKLLFKVENGATSVEDTDREANFTLEHLDAINFLFAPVCAKRRTAPAEVQGFFPLPIYIFSADGV